MSIPLIYPGSPNVRSTDPIASHLAGDKAVKSVPAKVAIERVLADSNQPLTADAIWHHLRNDLGFFCSRERVRTVLNEGAGLAARTKDRFNAFVRLPDMGLSDLGNPAHLWRLADE